MSTRFLLRLLCLPTLIGAVGLFPLTAAASTARTDKISTSVPAASCSVVDEKAALNAADHKSTGDVLTLDFSAAASDAAVLLFGCDCPSCISALEQLRRPSLLTATGSHCLESLTEDSPYADRVDDILTAVDEAEAISPDVPLPRNKF